MAAEHVPHPPARAAAADDGQAPAEEAEEGDGRGGGEEVPHLRIRLAAPAIPVHAAPFAGPGLDARLPTVGKRGAGQAQQVTQDQGTQMWGREAVI